jgi:CRP-like cAMP-binding protein
LIRAGLTRAPYTDSAMMPQSPKQASRDARDLPVTSGTLREIGLFGALSDEILDYLSRTLKTSRVSPGDTVFLEGDGLAREMYVLLEGEMEVSKRSRRGRDKRIAILGPTDWFGEMSMLDMQPRSATVRALAPSRMLRMTSEDLDALYRFDVKSYALIVLNIARDLSRRLRVTDGILADFAVNVLDEYVVAQKL